MPDKWGSIFWGLLNYVAHKLMLLISWNNYLFQISLFIYNIRQLFISPLMQDTNVQVDYYCSLSYMCNDVLLSIYHGV